jgi:predicted  nucleic acid-binding Zn-ribbon protein
VQTEESDLAREQKKAEQAVDQVRVRAERDQKRLDSGVVNSPKDLENLQRELVSLAKRQGALEDAVLEVMERQEAAQARRVELLAAKEKLSAKLDEVTERRNEAATGIDSDQVTAAKDRETIAAVIPEDLLALYTKLRAQNGGIGAARLYQRRCEGCRIELGVTEINAVRSAVQGSVVRCENCRRILIRTAESGL